MVFNLKEQIEKNKIKEYLKRSKLLLAADYDENGGIIVEDLYLLKGLQLITYGVKTSVAPSTKLEIFVRDTIMIKPVMIDDLISKIANTYDLFLKTDFNEFDGGNKVLK